MTEIIEEESESLAKENYAEECVATFPSSSFIPLNCLSVSAYFSLICNFQHSEQHCIIDKMIEKNEGKLEMKERKEKSLKVQDAASESNASHWIIKAEENLGFRNSPVNLKYLLNNTSLSLFINRLFILTAKNTFPYFLLQKILESFSSISSYDSYLLNLLGCYFFSCFSSSASFMLSFPLSCLWCSHSASSCYNINKLSCESLLSCISSHASFKVEKCENAYNSSCFSSGEATANPILKKDTFFHQLISVMQREIKDHLKTKFQTKENKKPISVNHESTLNKAILAVKQNLFLFYNSSSLTPSSSRTSLSSLSSRFCSSSSSLTSLSSRTSFSSLSSRFCSSSSSYSSFCYYLSSASSFSASCSFSPSSSPSSAFSSSHHASKSTHHLDLPPFLRLSKNSDKSNSKQMSHFSTSLSTQSTFDTFSSFSFLQKKDFFVASSKISLKPSYKTDNQTTLKSMLSCIINLPNNIHVRESKGSCFDDFHVLLLIGCGTYARVWKVQHKITGRIYAAKLLQPTLFSLDAFERVKEMFSKEVYNLSICQCEGVVRMKELVYGRDGWLLVQEYVNDGTIWKSNICKSEEDIFLYFIQILQSVLFLQKKHIVHRDIKPTNILKFSNKKIVLADFGWSEYIIDCAKHPMECPGTLEINPPEVLTFRGPCTEKIDNYAIGMNFLLLISGKFICRRKDLDVKTAASYLLKTIHMLRNSFPPPQDFLKIPGTWQVFLGLTQPNPDLRWSLNDVLSKSTWVKQKLLMFSRKFNDFIWEETVKEKVAFLHRAQNQFYLDLQKKAIVLLSHEGCNLRKLDCNNNSVLSACECLLYHKNNKMSNNNIMIRNNSYEGNLLNNDINCEICQHFNDKNYVYNAYNKNSIIMRNNNTAIYINHQSPHNINISNTVAESNAAYSTSNNKIVYDNNYYFMCSNNNIKNNIVNQISAKNSNYDSSVIDCNNYNNSYINMRYSHSHNNNSNNAKTNHCNLAYIGKNMKRNVEEAYVMHCKEGKKQNVYDANLGNSYSASSRRTTASTAIPEVSCGVRRVNLGKNSSCEENSKNLISECVLDVENNEDSEVLQNREEFYEELKTEENNNECISRSGKLKVGKVTNISAEEKKNQQRPEKTQKQIPELKLQETMNNKTLKCDHNVCICSYKSLKARNSNCMTVNNNEEYKRLDNAFRVIDNEKSENVLKSSKGNFFLREPLQKNLNVKCRELKTKCFYANHENNFLRSNRELLFALNCQGVSTEMSSRSIFNLRGKHENQKRDNRSNSNNNIVRLTYNNHHHHHNPNSNNSVKKNAEIIDNKRSKLVFQSNANVRSEKNDETVFNKNSCFERCVMKRELLLEMQTEKKGGALQLNKKNNKMNKKYYHTNTQKDAFSSENVSLRSSFLCSNAFPLDNIYKNNHFRKNQISENSRAHIVTSTCNEKMSRKMSNVDKNKIIF